jgi:hypothetical protein
VRGALALAAARAGDEARALSLVRGADEARAAAVLATLSAAALGQGALERAEEHLAAARRADRRHPAVEGVAAQLAAARAARRAPAEAELSALLAAGREDEARAAAEAVLARWPESEAARRTARALEERRRAREIERLVGEAEALGAAGDAAAAEARLARALTAAGGPEREAIARALRALQDAEQARREGEQVEQVAALLGAPDATKGLLAYLALDEPLRARLRVGAGAERLRRLDLTGRGAPRARVEAVLALAEAQALGPADPEGALGRLAPQASLLERVPEAQQLTRACQATLAERRRARAAAALAAARASFTAGEAAAALARLDEETVAALSPGDRAEAAALRAEATRLVDRARRVADVGRRRAAGQLFEARALAEGLAAESAGDERARWEAEQRALQAAIQCAYRVEVDDAPRPFDVRADLNGRFSIHDANFGLTADGSALVQGETQGRRLLLQVIDLAGFTLRATVSLSTPAPLGSIAVTVHGDVAWIVGRRGLLALDLRTWEIRLQRLAGELLPPGATQIASDALPVGGDAKEPRFLWILACDDDDLGCPARVIDLQQRRIVREVGDVTRIVPVAGLPAACVAGFRENGGLVLHEDRGALLPARRLLPPGMRPLSLSVHPDGQGLVVMAQSDAPERAGQALSWIEVPGQGPPRAPRRIEGGDGRYAAPVACALDAGLVAIVFYGLAGAWELLVLHAVGGALTPLYRVPVSEGALLVQDSRARRLWALDFADEHVSAAEIGPAPPALPVEPQRGRWLGAVLLVGDCFAPAAYLAPVQREVARDVGDLSAYKVSVWCRGFQLRAEASGDPAPQTVEAILSLERLGAAAETEAKRLRAWLGDTRPGDFNVRVLRADELCRRGCWAEAAAVLAAEANPTPDLDEEPRLRHFHHLAALAAFHTGQLDRAREMLAEARGYPGPCDLAGLTDLLAPEEGSARPLARASAALRAADACLSRGDVAGARAAMDLDLLWVTGEVQILARRAELALRTAAEGRRARFDKTLVLARFFDAHAQTRPGDRHEVPFPGAIWDRARLDEVAARAKAWLEGESEGA